MGRRAANSRALRVPAGRCRIDRMLTQAADPSTSRSAGRCAIRKVAHYVRRMAASTTSAAARRPSPPFPAPRSRDAHRPARSDAAGRATTALLVTSPTSRSSVSRSRRAPAATSLAFASPTSSRHAPVAAVQHADDHFLPDVAALGEADRARFDAGLERNRLFVHVLMKFRDAALRREALRRSPRRSRRRRPRCSAARSASERDASTSTSKPGSPRSVIRSHDRRLARERGAQVAVFGERR